MTAYQAETCCWINTRLNSCCVLTEFTATLIIHNATGMNRLNIWYKTETCSSLLKTRGAYKEGRVVPTDSKRCVGCAVEERQGQRLLLLFLHCVSMKAMTVPTEHATRLASPLFAITVTVFVLMYGKIYYCIWGDDLWNTTTGNGQCSLGCGKNRPKKLCDSTKSNASVLPYEL